MKEQKVTVVFGGETEGYFRFKLNGKENNLRLYIQKGKEIPDELVIDLRAAKKLISRGENDDF